MFDEETELDFFRAADNWSFPVHFLLAKTGLRPGELRHLLIEELDLESGWLHVRNKPDLGWRIKTGRERSAPLIEESVLVLRRVIGKRSTGPVFLRPLFCTEKSKLNKTDFQSLVKVGQSRISQAGEKQVSPLSREQEAALFRSVWRDAGAVRSEVIRQTYIRAARGGGISQTTCPKSWRHTFATLLQDANVDPLIRQITLGHKLMNDAKGALGMTGVYTHTRPETQKREIERALRLWPRSLEFASNWADRVR